MKILSMILAVLIWMLCGTSCTPLNALREYSKTGAETVVPSEDPSKTEEQEAASAPRATGISNATITSDPTGLPAPEQTSIVGPTETPAPTAMPGLTGTSEHASAPELTITSAPVFSDDTETETPEIEIPEDNAENQQAETSSSTAPQSVEESGMPVDENGDVVFPEI